MSSRREIQVQIERQKMSRSKEMSETTVETDAL